MKVSLRSLLLFFLFLSPAQLFAQTLIAGWDFQTTTGGGTASAAAPNSPLVYVANVGTGTLYLDGSNGSSTWTSIGTSSPQVTSFGGTNVNATNGLGTATTSALAVANSTSNGFGMVFKVTTTGIKSLVVSYATQGTTTGFNTQLWQYSTDATTWTTFASISPRTNAASTFATANVITLPPIVDLNATTTYVKVIVSGASAATGNNRFDNVQILTGPTVYYSKSSGDLSSASSYGPNADGSGTPPSDLTGSGYTVYELANRSGSFALTTNLTIGTSLIIPTGSTLDLAGNTLTATSITGGGLLSGSATSSLVVNGSALVGFTTGKQQLKNLTVAAIGNNTLGLTTPLNIISTGTVTMTNGALGSNGFLTLKSDASGTASIATVASQAGAGVGGNVIAERFIFDKRAWRLIGTPVLTTQTINAAWQEGATGVSSDPNPGFGTFMVGTSTANGFDIASTSGSLLVYSAGALSNAANTTILTPSSNQGYFLFSIGSRSINPSDGVSHSSTVLRTTGTVKQGTQTAVAVAATGYTLVGNPFPSAVDFSAVTRSATVQNNFYAWDINLGTYGGYVFVSNSGGGYTSVPTSPSGLNNIIPSGGAVFVQSDGTTAGTVTFAEASKAGAGSGTFSSFPTSVANTTHNFRVNLADGTSNLIDGVMASYATGYSNNVDAGDAAKLFNFYENIALSRAGKQLIVEQRNNIIAKDTIFIQLSGVKTAAYQLQIDPADFNEPGMVAYLEDAYAHTHTKLDLTQVSNISFNTNTADTTSYKNRFQISFTPASELFAFVNATAANAGKQNILKWNVTGEDYVQQYTVEKWNGTAYTAITSVSATLAGSYTAADNALLPGDNMYRITAKDSYGNVMYSNSVTVKISHIGANVVAYPNPAIQKQINLSFDGMPVGNYSITVMNTSGQIMQTNNMIYNGTAANKLLSADYASGMYIVNIKSANYAQSIKVIIQ